VLALSGSTLYAGGTFDQVNGSLTRHDAAAFDTATATATGFDPDLDQTVFALAVGDSDVYVGGQFLSAGGVGRAHLAAFDRNGDRSDWNPGTGPADVRALVATPNGLVAGGQFVGAGGTDQEGFALFPGAVVPPGATTAVGTSTASTTTAATATATTTQTTPTTPITTSSPVAPPRPPALPGNGSALLAPAFRYGSAAAPPVTRVQIPFDASSTLSTAPIAAYSWNLDGKPGFEDTCDGSDPVLLTSFTHPGTYDVGLEATDVFGNAAISDEKITIGGSEAPAVRNRAVLPAYACASGTLDANCPQVVFFDGVVASTTEGCFSEQKVRGIRTSAGRAAIPDLANLLPTASESAIQHVLTDEGTLWTTSAPIMLNGLLVTPLPGYKGPAPTSRDKVDTESFTFPAIMLASYPDLSYIGASAADIEVPGAHPVTLADDVLLDDVLDPAASPSDAVDWTTLPDIAPLHVKLLGFDLSGTPKLELVDGQVKATMNVKLPIVQSDPIKLTFTVDSDRGLLLDDLDFDAHDVTLGPLTFDSLHVAYHKSSDEWDASGGVSFDPPGAAFDAGVKFIHGNLQQIFGNVTFPDPGIPVSGIPIVFLSGVGLDVDGLELAPLTLTGTIALNAGGKVTTPLGTLEVASIDGSLTYTDGSPWTIDANGNLSVLGIPVGDEDLFVDGDGLVSFHAGVDLGLFSAVHYKGEFDAAFWGGDRFNLYGRGDVDVLDAVDVGGELDVSSQGLAGCAFIDTFLGDISIGVGMHWGGLPHPMFLDCDVGPYSETVPAHGAEASSAHAAASVAVAPRQRAVVIAGVGSDAPPALVLTGPGGERIDAPAKGFVHTPRYAVLHDRASKQTFVVVAGPAAGPWRVQAASGSTLLRVRTAPVLPVPSVHAHVHAAGGRSFVLDYRVSRIPGQQVSFFEVVRGATHPLGTVDAAGTGSLRFAAVDGPAGPRQIIALVTRNGLTRARLAVASYAAPPPIVPRPLRALTLRRANGTLRAAWAQSAGALRYRVAVRRSDGERFVVSTRARHVAAAGFSPAYGATVTVTPLRGAHAGRPATARIAAVRGAVAPGSPRATIFDAPRSARRGAAIDLAYVLTSRATLTLTVQGDGRATVVARRAARGGLGILRWNGRLGGRPARPGRYTLTLTATGTGGAETTSPPRTITIRAR